MRKMLFALTVIAFAAGTAWAGPNEKPAEAAKMSATDTIMVTVYPGAGPNQFRFEVFAVNADSVAGMPIPLRVTSEGAKLMFDSASFAGSRTEYFQLKTQNADTAAQTVLFGLIADLSGSKPPLAPGRGKALTFFCTAEKPVKPDQVGVAPVILPPANKLEFNVWEDGQVKGVRPTFVLKTGKAEKKMEQKGEVKTEKKAAPKKEEGGN